MSIEKDAGRWARNRSHSQLENEINRIDSKLSRDKLSALDPRVALTTGGVGIRLAINEGADALGRRRAVLKGRIHSSDRAAMERFEDDGGRR